MPGCQDTSSFSSQSKTAGAGVSVCIPPICYGEVVSVSASLSAAKVNGDFKSVAEQSGIKAADGGFQIKVGGNTDLKGAVITSSQSAVEQNKNSLATATLTTSELQNKDQYSASGFSVSYGSSGGGSAGLGMSSGDQRSTTKSGISAGRLTITDEPGQKALTGQDAATTLASLNTQVTTDKDTSGAIKKQWDGQKLQQEVQAQAQITAAFGSAAAKEVGDYAASKTQPIIDANNYLALKDAQNNGTLSEAGQARLTQMETKSGYTPEKAQATLKDPQAQQDYDNWKEGGAYRVAAHTVVGAMAGGVSGALGSGASAAAAPMLDDLQASTQTQLTKAGLGQDAAKAVSKLVGSAAATAVGTVASGGSVVGAAAAANEDLNNRQLTHNEADRIKKLANGDAQKKARLTAAACAMAQCAAGVPTDDPSYAFLKGLQDAGAGMTAEQALLRQQTGQVGRATQGLFTYDPIVDTAGDYLAQNKMGTRLAGAVQGGAGIAGVAGSSALCTTGVGCLAGAVGATVSADYAQAGVRQAFTGDAKVTQGEQVLQSLGLSPQAAAITYGLIGVLPAVDPALVGKVIGTVGKTAASTLDRATSSIDAGAIAAQKVDNNFYREGSPLPQALFTSSGIPIQATLGKTTTVLGSYAADTSSIINNQLGYPKTIDFAAKPGGFNVLNVPDNLYSNPSQFWSDINKPFLDAAILRNDEIVLATKPVQSILERVLPDGTAVKTGFGMELDYLKSHGYIYDPATGRMMKKGK